MKFKDITRVCDYCNKEFSRSTFYAVTTAKCSYDEQNNYDVARMKSLVLCKECGEMIINTTSITI